MRNMGTRLRTSWSPLLVGRHFQLPYGTQRSQKHFATYVEVVFDDCIALVIVDHQSVMTATS